MVMPLDPHALNEVVKALYAIPEDARLITAVHSLANIASASPEDLDRVLVHIRANGLNHEALILG